MAFKELVAHFALEFNLLRCENVDWFWEQKSRCLEMKLSTCRKKNRDDTIQNDLYMNYDENDKN